MDDPSLVLSPDLHRSVFSKQVLRGMVMGRSFPFETVSRSIVLQLFFIFFAVAIFVGVVAAATNSLGKRSPVRGSTSRVIGSHEPACSFEDALADARRWTERLGGQVLQLTGTDTASTQAMADASERFTAANAQLDQAQTVHQARGARESALEGLYYVRAAREIMNLPLGPELPPLEGQRQAGQVTQTRTINHEGRTLTASPVASQQTPNYYPGGMVAGRPVPAGWYSEPWWAGALSTGMWTAASFMLFSHLFSGMHGVNYGADAFASGYGDGYQDGLAAADVDGGDMFEGADASADGLGSNEGGSGWFGGDDNGGGLFGDGGLFDGDFDFDF